MCTSFKELHADYARRFGENWDREGLEYEEELAFVEACYKIYPLEFKVRDGFKSMTEADAANNGRPFEIIGPLYESDDWDLECLPGYKIEFSDNGERYDAYPEEVYDIPY